MTGSSSERTLEPERGHQEEHSGKDERVPDHEKSDNQAPGGHGEEGNSAPDPPLPVGLFDPSLKAVRREVLKKWSITVLVLFCFILCVLSLYWACLFHVPQNLSALTVAVVSFDGRVSPYDNIRPLVGPVVEELAREQAALPAYAVGYRIESPEKYGYDPLAVRQAVYDEHVWAAIIVNANATALLQQAVATGNASYSPLGACQIIINSARDETTYGNYLDPQLFEFSINAAAEFGEQWIQNVLSNTSLDAATYGRAPQALNPAIGFSFVSPPFPQKRVSLPCFFNFGTI